MVVDAPGEPLRRAPRRRHVVSVVQEQALGTADALRARQAHIDHDAPVVVLTGDVPLITPETIAALARAQQRDRRGRDDPDRDRSRTRPATGGSSARRDGTVEKVVETKRPEDATPARARDQGDQRRGSTRSHGAALLPALARVGNDNAQGEYYLPDVLPLLRARAHLVTALELAGPRARRSASTTACNWPRSARSRSGGSTRS